jgi:hypothetical protein
MIRRSSLVLCYLTITLSTASILMKDGWKLYNAKNCYDNAGAIQIPITHTGDLDYCKSVCVGLDWDNCEGFVYRGGSPGECQLRKNINIQECRWSSRWNVYLKPTEEEIKEAKKKEEERLIAEKIQKEKEAEAEKVRKLQKEKEDEAERVRIQKEKEAKAERVRKEEAEKREKERKEGEEKQEMCDKIARYEALCSNLKNENDNLQLQCKYLNDINENLNNENGNLKLQCNDLNNEIEDLNRHIYEISKAPFEYQVPWLSSGALQSDYKELLSKSMAAVLKISSNLVKVLEFAKPIDNSSSIIATYQIDDPSITTELLTEHKTAIQILLNEKIITMDNFELITTLELQCPICYSNPPNIEYPGCSHKYCDQCFDNIKYKNCCPICRNKNETVLSWQESLAIKNKMEEQKETDKAAVVAFLEELKNIQDEHTLHKNRLIVLQEQYIKKTGITQ